MAINDVSLTSGMRSNLIALQGTVDLLNRTQQRLSTGKKVNSAIDNPVSFFASQALTSRASVIDSLKDAMGQAVQTISAADKGIKAITSMIEQAKGVAQAALSAEVDATASSVTLSRVTNTSFVGGGPAEVQITVQAGMTAGDTVTFRGVVLTAVAANPGANQFVATGNAVTDADALSMAILLSDPAFPYVISSHGTATFEVSYWPSATTDDPIDLTTADVTISAHATAQNVAGTGGDSVTIGGVTLMASFNAAYAAASDTLFYVGPAYNEVSNSQFAINLADEINNNATLAAAGYTATASNGNVSLSRTVGGAPVAITSGDIGGTHSNITVTDVSSSSELDSLEAQYNTLMSQLTELAEDSGYKGKNLLSHTSAMRSMTVKFEGTTLSVQGFDATAVGLGLADAIWTGTASQITAAIEADLDRLDTALVTLRQNSSSLSGNLSIITVRQDFSTNMVNALTEGSNKLTLADANQEGASMLMLQTRQSLSTSALSMSAQAAQSVLRLFQ